MKTTGILGALTVLSVAAVILMNSPLLLGQGAHTPTQLPTKSSLAAPNGLLLELSISSSEVGAGQPLVVSVDSFNPGTSYLNVTSDRSWAVQGLRINSCYASVYPFGIALYQGNYAIGNLSSGQPLQIFPNVPCPLLIRLVTGYYFSPNSSNAAVLPGTGPATPISANVTISGTYKGSSPQQLSAGTYTLVAGDEWGTLVLLKFQVH